MSTAVPRTKRMREKENARKCYDNEEADCLASQGHGPRFVNLRVSLTFTELSYECQIQV